MTIDPKNAAWAAEYPFQSHWLERDGARMHYLDEGPRDAPVLLMMHGNPTWSFYYRNLVKAFSADFRCIVPDHIGCGLSDKPQDYDYTLARRIDDVEALLNELGIARFNLVVHDWGGAIGMGVAARRPDAVDRVVVFNTAAFRDTTIPFSINICKIPLFGDVAVRGLNGFVRAAQFRAIYDRARLAGPIREAYLAPYDSWANRVAIHAFVKDIPMNSSHPTWDTLGAVEQALPQFTDRPMLIVWGDDDFCFSPHFRRRWEKFFPDAEVHALPHASHFVVEDARDDVIHWMSDFLHR
mgnify:CR=1 FL=1